MNEDESWNLLQQRCEDIALHSNSYEVGVLLTILADTTLQYRNKDSEARLSKVITAVCQTLLMRWNKQLFILNSNDLSLYRKLSLVSEPLIQMPNLTHSWDVRTKDFRDWLGKCNEQGYIDDVSELEEWVNLIDSIYRAEPRFLEKIGFPHKYEKDIEILIELIDFELQDTILSEDYDILIYESEKLDAIVNSLCSLQNFFPKISRRLSALASEVTRKRNELQDVIVTQEHFEDIDYDERASSARESFDIDSIFEDL